MEYFLMFCSAFSAMMFTQFFWFKEANINVNIITFLRNNPSYTLKDNWLFSRVLHWKKSTKVIWYCLLMMLSLTGFVTSLIIILPIDEATGLGLLSIAAGLFVVSRIIYNSTTYKLKLDLEKLMWRGGQKVELVKLFEFDPYDIGGKSFIVMKHNKTLFEHLLLAGYHPYLIFHDKRLDDSLPLAKMEFVMSNVILPDQSGNPFEINYPISTLHNSLNTKWYSRSILSCVLAIRLDRGFTTPGFNILMDNVQDGKAGYRMMEYLYGHVIEVNIGRVLVETWKHGINKYFYDGMCTFNYYLRQYLGKPIQPVDESMYGTLLLAIEKEKTKQLNTSKLLHDEKEFRLSHH